ncbi:MAG: hypothetical protein ABL307_04695 [Roseitalea porphyridii]|uniref:hypothetical protein n=1 Tax=Roseitalea porphyridii TaxID=1852022 RepID=UPI0032D8C907
MNSDWQLLFGLFAAFLAWGTGANIFRVSHGFAAIGLATTSLGLASFVAVHILPFLLLAWWQAIIAIAMFHIVSGALSGLLIGLYVGRPNWPENFMLGIRYGPPSLFLASLIVIGLIWMNEGA